MKKTTSVEESMLLTSESYVESRKYWLANIGTILSGDREYMLFPSENTGVREMKRFKPDDEVAEKLFALCKGNDLSLYIYFLTAFSILVSKYKGPGYFAVASPSLREGINDYNDLLPLLCWTSDTTTFKERLVKIQETVLGAIKHQRYPVSRIYEELNVLSNDQQFDVLFSCKSLHTISEAANQPFRVELEVEGKEITVAVSSATELPFGLDIFFNHIQEVIRQSIQQLDIVIEEIDILSGEERIELLQLGGKQSGSAGPGQDFKWSGHVSRQLAAGGEHSAIVYKEAGLTYSQMNSLAKKSVHYFRTQLKLRKGDRVAVVVKRTEWMPAIAIFLLQNGLVYVPVDINNPADRIRSLLEDAQPSLLIMDASLQYLAGEITCRCVEVPALINALEACEEEEIPGDIRERDEAYIIYTSGSTGKPKGVVVTHGNLNHFLGNVWTRYVKEKPLTLPFIASNAFDISLFQLLTPLISGGTILVLDKEQLTDSDQLLAVLAASNAIDTVPALYGQIVNQIRELNMQAQFDHIQQVFIGGDYIPDSLLYALAKIFRTAVITVTYGPTEGTIFTTDLSYEANDITADTKGTIIGRPIGEGQIFILGHKLELLPHGIDGEICIGGPGVSKGYFQRAEQTAERFVEHPYDPGTLLYRTGDMGRWSAAGLLEFRGRKDDQLKINGYRIELQEIEKCMQQHDGVADAAIGVALLNNSEKALTGYYVKKNRMQIWPSISEYLGYNEMAYFAMNNDASRVNSYRKAIEQIAGGKVMMDVGTGPDAILAQYCIQAGAEKVYAIELREDAYYRAKHTVKSLGLEEKIIVIHGNIMDVELPEKVDYCICALVGNMGSTDGCVPIMNSARKWLKDESCMIPYRSRTKIAAINLKEERMNYAFTQTGGQYLKEIFDFTGGVFDLRIGLQNVTESDLVSTADDFEVLELSQYLPLDKEWNVELTIISDSEISGFLVWLHLYTRPDIVYDIFQNQKSFLPIYWPVFESPVSVKKGDVIKAKGWRSLPEGQICPDLGIEGELIRMDGSREPFYYLSNKRSKVLSSGKFYSKVFPGGKWTEKPALSAPVLQTYLKEKLPEYMVPHLLLEVAHIPLTPNGKVDRKQLADLQVIADESLKTQYVPPQNVLESTLAIIWQNLLGVTRVGTHDNFFQLGGDSIISIQMVSRARRAGYELRVADIFTHQTIAALSKYLIDQKGVVLHDRGEQGLLTGNSGLLPTQQWYFETKHSQDACFNQSVLISIKKGVTEEDLEQAVAALMNQHDALRFTYTTIVSGWQQEYGHERKVFLVEDLRSATRENLGQEIGYCAVKYQQQLHIETGNLVRVVLMKTPDAENENRLLIVVHHLVVDGVSWRILLEDLELLLSGQKKGAQISPEEKSTSCRQWFQALESYGKTERLLSQSDYWKGVTNAYKPLPVDMEDAGIIRVSDTGFVFSRLSQAQTHTLLRHVPRVYDTEMNDLLLAALAQTLSQWTGRKEVIVGLEGHGREDIGERSDLSRTVGWLANIYPVLLTTTHDSHAGDLLKGVKEQLRHVPDKGIGYGVLKYINKIAQLQGIIPWDIVFNFLGQLDNITNKSEWFSGANESSGSDTSDMFIVDEKISLNGMIAGGELLINWRYSKLHYRETTVRELSRMYLSNLDLLIRHCVEHKSSDEIYASSEYNLKGERPFPVTGGTLNAKSDNKTILEF